MARACMCGHSHPLPLNTWPMPGLARRLLLPFLYMFSFPYAHAQVVSQEIALAQARREVAAKNGLVTTLHTEVTALQVALRKQAEALDAAAGPRSVEAPTTCS